MRIRNQVVATATAVAIAAIFGACGGGSSPTSPSTGGGGTTPSSSGSGNVITITGSGVSPKPLTVSPGTRVQFVNNDTTNPFHEMNSDPHPEHTNCPEINQVGFIVAGQTKETENLNTVGTCGYHDHNRDSDTRWQGQIVIR